MRKNTKSNKLNMRLKKSWRKIAAIFGLGVSFLFVAGLFATLNVLQKFNYEITQAQALTVSLNVQPSPTTLNSLESKAFSLSLNSNGRSISFVRGVLLFDNTKLELMSEIDVTMSPLTTVVEKTSRTAANTNGRAAVVLALPPDARSNPPTGTIVLGNMTFRAKSTTAQNVSTQISIDTGDSQVVDLQETNLTVSGGSSTITINPNSNATVPPVTNPPATVRPSTTARPTVRPTATSRATFRPTVRPTVRPSIRPTQPPSGGGSGGGSLPGFPSGVNLSNLRQYCPLYRTYRTMAFRIYGSRYPQAFAYMDSLCR